MPSPRPVPRRTIRHSILRIMRLAAALSIAIAAIAVLLVARGQSEPQVHMLIATALGIALSVLMASALMGLIILSHRRGHDAGPGARHHESDE